MEWMEAKTRGRVRVAKVKFSVDEHVLISKKKMMFAKGTELNFSTQIFRIAKVMERSPHPPTNKRV